MKIELPREIKDIIVVLLERVFGIGIFTRRFEIHAHCIYIGGGGTLFSIIATIIALKESLQIFLTNTYALLVRRSLWLVNYAGEIGAVLRVDTA